MFFFPRSEVKVLRKASLLRATYLSLYISSARLVDEHLIFICYCMLKTTRIYIPGDIFHFPNLYPRGQCTTRGQSIFLFDNFQHYPATYDFLFPDGR